MKFSQNSYQEFLDKNPGSNLNFEEWKKKVSFSPDQMNDDFQIGSDGSFYFGEFYSEDEVDLKPKPKFRDSWENDDPDEV